MRKHPEVLALSVICLALFVNIGVRKAISEVQRSGITAAHQEVFRVRQLVDSELRRQDPVREGILCLRDALRSLRP